uniref:Uncharacterized protein n=1 Tax=Heterorhabditis bacteriophora TaxID=37862 RepID=A0A1I7WAT1_HETBA
MINRTYIYIYIYWAEQHAGLLNINNDDKTIKFKNYLYMITMFVF